MRRLPPDADPAQRAAHAGFGRAVAAIRAERTIPVEDAATTAGLTPAAWQNLEHGNGNPTFDQLHAIAAALDTTLRELATRADPD